MTQCVWLVFAFHVLPGHSFSWRLFFVQGAAFGGINPAVFVPLTSLHTSQTMKDTADCREAVEGSLVLMQPTSEMAKMPQCKLCSHTQVAGHFNGPASVC